MAENLFVLPPDAYKREVNLMQDYLSDAVLYLSKMTGASREQAQAFIKESLRPGGQFEFKDPTVVYLERKENGDREKCEGTLLGYITSAIRDKDLIAPTLTTYLSPEVKKSLLVDYVDDNVAGRSVAKKQMFAAQQAGDKELEEYKSGEQTGRKLSNNALSGAHVSNSTPLNNKTAHSTLTSCCRSTSGYGNANNEKFLCGNRHYWSADIVRNNIISIINHTDYPQLQKAIETFGIVYPTAHELHKCLMRSAHLYWRSSYQELNLMRLIETLSPLERAAVAYTGDFYELKELNDALARDFITSLSMRVNKIHPNAEAVVKAASDDVRSLAVQLCPREFKGVDMSKIDKKGEAYGILASTIENIEDTLQRYSLLIQAFWVTPNVPASLAHFPDSIRRSALTSDTDSTIFTVQDWVLWHQGRIGFDDMCNGVAAALIFLASSTITHVLARMSANFGIEKKRLFQIAMKNEFKFDVFVPTQVAKHYFALIGCREGNLYAKYKEEIKGVHLKSSNAPPVVMKEAKKMMLFIMNSTIEEKKISSAFIFKWIADIERSIIDSITRGSYEYFRKIIIKNPSAYVDGEEAAPYQQYLMWKDVFAEKYGASPELPYMGVRVSVDLSSPTKTREWLDSIEDKVFVARIESWMAKQNKKFMGSNFTLPEQCISMGGIPPEVLQVVGVRKIVLNTTRVFYLILESLGIYMLNDKITRLISDHY